MTDLIDTTEMYLRTILELEEEGVVPLRARIAERLGHSGPTVSQTVARMERDGLVKVNEDRQLSFTPQGHEKAVRVMRKHRLSERLLHDVIGLEWEFVHAEACRWEHVVSERVERRVLELIDSPARSPYGNPIPGLGELGMPTRGAFVMPVVSVTEVFSENGAAEFTAQIDRIAEPLQLQSGVLGELNAAGAIPGSRSRFQQTPAGVRLSTQTGFEVVLERSSAAHIFVLRQDVF